MVANQTRAFAADPKAQGRINSLYMTATFVGGALGATVSGALMARFGWHGVVAFGIAAEPPPRSCIAAGTALSRRAP